jgi:hypothetical protein
VKSVFGFRHSIVQRLLLWRSEEQAVKKQPMKTVCRVSYQKDPFGCGETFGLDCNATIGITSVSGGQLKPYMVFWFRK